MVQCTWKEAYEKFTVLGRKRHLLQNCPFLHLKTLWCHRAAMIKTPSFGSVLSQHGEGEHGGRGRGWWPPWASWEALSVRQGSSSEIKLILRLYPVISPHWGWKQNSRTSVHWNHGRRQLFLHLKDPSWCLPDPSALGTGWVISLFTKFQLLQQQQQQPRRMFMPPLSSLLFSYCGRQ